MLTPWWYWGIREKHRTLSFKENIVRKEEVKIIKQDLCQIFLKNIIYDVHDAQIKQNNAFIFVFV